MLQKLYRHLEEINANTRQQLANEEANADQYELWSGKINTQLEMLNASLRSVDKRRPRRGLQAVSFFLAGLGLALLGILATYTFRLSTVADVARDRSTASLQAYSLVNSRYNQVNDKALDLEAHTARLDSVVEEQTRTIEELKKLNISAVRTIFFLERKLQRQQEFEHTQAMVR